MNISLRDRVPFAKILIVLAVVFVIAVGLFLLAAALPDAMVNRAPRDKFDFGLLGDVAGAIALFSALGFVATITLRMGLGVIASFSRKEAEPQRLIYDGNDKEKAN